MECRLIQTDLVAYYFGLLEGEARQALESHLCSCLGCIRALVELNQNREFEPLAGLEKPSESLRARLRKDVAATFGSPFKKKLKDFFFMPVPAYQAAAFIFFVMFFVFDGQREFKGRQSELSLNGVEIQSRSGLSDHETSEPPTSKIQFIDTSRVNAENVNYL